MRYAQFLFDNRLSYALSKYPNFPALLRRENEIIFHLSQPPLQNLPIFWEPMWILSWVLAMREATVFVLITDFLMPF